MRRYLALLVEIDRDHPLVDHLLVHERHFALGALRDVIEHLTVEGGDGGRRAHHDQHLILAGADRNLLERARRQDVALLELLAGAGSQRQAHTSAAAATARQLSCTTPRSERTLKPVWHEFDHIQN